MSVVLLYPPHYFRSNSSSKEPYGGIDAHWGQAPPLGLLYLASSLLSNGVKVHVVDLNEHRLGLKESVDLIEQSTPRVVGISATSFQLRGAVQLAEALRERFGDKVIIGLGGVHVSVDPDFINRFPIFDFEVIGEGEITFSSLVTKILNGENVHGVFRGEVPLNLDNLPFPARHLIDTKMYFSGDRCATILATRGCPFDCVFCSIKTLRGQRVRYRSPKNVADEMDAIVKTGTKRFWFVDDTFTVNKDYAIALCEEIIHRKLDVEWCCETRIACVDENILKVMRSAGCIKISFGIESGSARIRTDIIHKGFTNEQAIRVFNLCKKYGISPEAYLMVGFPTESAEDLRSTKSFSSKLNADTIGVHIAQILPGSDLFTIALKEGKIKADVYDQYAKGELSGSLPVYVPEGLSLIDLQKTREQAYRQFYFKPKFLLKRLGKDLRSFSNLKNDLSVAKKLFFEGKTVGTGIAMNRLLNKIGRTARA